MVYGVDKPAVRRFEEFLGVFRPCAMLSRIASAYRSGFSASTPTSRRCCSSCSSVQPGFATSGDKPYMSINDRLQKTILAWASTCRGLERWCRTPGRAASHAVCAFACRSRSKYPQQAATRSSRRGTRNLPYARTGSTLLVARRTPPTPGRPPRGQMSGAKRAMSTVRGTARTPTAALPDHPPGKLMHGAPKHVSAAARQAAFPPLAVAGVSVIAISAAEHG